MCDKMTASLPGSEPTSHSLPLQQDLRWLVDGKIFNQAGNSIPVYSPVVVEGSHPILGRIAQLEELEACMSLAAAEKAYDRGIGDWPMMTVSQRIACMNHFIQLIEPLGEQFATMEMWEIAKPIIACRDEFHRTLEYIKDTIAVLEDNQTSMNRIQPIESYISLLRRTPLGVVLCMGPYNYPLNETFAMMIPALLMGNPVIMKPPDYGCLCTLLFLDAFAEAFPPGVVNVITGSGETIIDPLLKSGHIDVLAFIGSTGVANKLAALHPHPNRFTTVLGLEAKNPAYIMADADLDQACAECVQGALEYNGQRCTSIKHIWVHQDIAEDFIGRISKKVDALKCGPPWQADVMITPLPDQSHVKRMESLLNDALQKGAQIANHRSGLAEGTLWQPTVLYPVTENMDIAREEQFGPIVPVSTFRDADELVRYQVGSRFGQQASIFASSASTCLPLLDILANQVGRINLNSQCRRSPDQLPFTGRKDSAEGVLSVGEALKTFSLPALVAANEHGKTLFWDIVKSGQSQFLRI